MRRLIDRSGPETAERIAARIRMNQILENVRRDMAEHFPKITGANVDAALAYQRERLAFYEVQS